MEIPLRSILMSFLFPILMPIKSWESGCARGYVRSDAILEEICINFDRKV
jgi:hypothetical protein